MKKFNTTNCWRSTLIFLIFYIVNSNCSSQTCFILSNELIGQGSTGVATNGISSLYSNPAGAASIKDISFTANYFMPYFIKELSNQNLSIAFPNQYGLFYSNINRYGYKLYNENRIALGYARSITPNFKFSFQFNFQYNQVIESGSGNNVFSCLGIQFTPQQSVNIGFFAFNPEKATIKINSAKEEIPSYISLGLKWLANSNLSIASEINKTFNYNTTTHFGIEYKINKIIIARIGTYGKPIVYTLGFGVQMESIKVDVSMTNHQTLGISSGLGITYQIPSNQ